ncbi:hypothetical protein CP533_1019 [Ophiocordyceps camponoti-saundersi (nom. inval.)]|nr:hypothetical protein CP533_1019 [Ophiocordyceps camponoti-saundersi (nom. inval.)]
MSLVQKALRMGSTQPVSGDTPLPFGYNIEPRQNFTSSPPAPAPGNPLLSDTEYRKLNTFFECVDQFDEPSFGEGLDFGEIWNDAHVLPPDLMGTATSYGPHPVAPLNYAHLQYTVPNQNEAPRLVPIDHHFMPSITPLNPHLAPYQQNHHHSDDILSAAATLSQPINGRPVSKTTVHVQSPDPPSAQPPLPLRHQNIEEFRADTRRSSNGADHGQGMAKWMAGPADRPVPNDGKATTAFYDDLQWGSDMNFDSRQGYALETPTEPTDAIIFGGLKSLLGSRSLENTPSNSPIIGDSSVHVKREERHIPPPRKRRKSGNGKEIIDQRVHETDDDDDDDNYSSSSSVRRRQMSGTDRTDASPPVDAPAAAAAPKSRSGKQNAKGTGKGQRENLTEDQKRENHIRSEKKRRSHIKAGFQSLTNMVPGLKGGVFSKSRTLTVAAEWLEELTAGNQELRDLLKKLDPEKAKAIELSTGQGTDSKK